MLTVWATIVAFLTEYGPGIAGGVVSLAFIKKLGTASRVYWGICSAFVAFYIGPAVADHFFKGAGPSTERAVKFLTGVMGMGTLPFLIDFVHGWVNRASQKENTP